MSEVAITGDGVVAALRFIESVPVIEKSICNLVHAGLRRAGDNAGLPGKSGSSISPGGIDRPYISASSVSAVSPPGASTALCAVSPPRTLTQVSLLKEQDVCFTLWWRSTESMREYGLLYQSHDGCPQAAGGRSLGGIVAGVIVVRADD